MKRDIIPIIVLLFVSLATTELLHEARVNGISGWIAIPAVFSIILMGILVARGIRAFSGK